MKITEKFKNTIASLREETEPKKVRSNLSDFSNEDLARFLAQTVVDSGSGFKDIDIFEFFYEGIRGYKEYTREELEQEALDITSGNLEKLILVLNSLLDNDEIDYDIINEE